jgi:hypothetical protein
MSVRSGTPVSSSDSSYQVVTPHYGLPVRVKFVRKTMAGLEAFPKEASFMTWVGLRGLLVSTFQLPTVAFREKN